MFFIGSIFAVIASALVYRISRAHWPLVVEQFLCDVRYNLMATREIYDDWITAKTNKNAKEQNASKITSSQECSAQPGRIAIVTGGSRGIGFEVVKMLLELDMEVIIACRTPAAGEKAIRQIRESGVKTGIAKVYRLDNASLESVKQFAADIKRDYKEIHVLINNAGVMFCPYEETVDGFEQQWAINYLSHFLLTLLLLPLLKAGGLPEQNSRIVNVTSCAHLLGKINFGDVNNKSRFLTKYAYAQSKLAQEIFTKKLQCLLKEKQYNVQVYSVHPGVVLTELFMHSHLWKIKSLLLYIFKTPIQGATSVAYAAVNKAVEKNGGIYITNCRPSYVHPDSSNSSVQNKLFELSLQQVKTSDFFQCM